MGFVPEELLERGTIGGCSQVYESGVGCRQWGPERKEHSSLEVAIVVNGIARIP